MENVRFPGLQLLLSGTPIEIGRDVAPLAHHLGFYSLNSCRVAYVIDVPINLDSPTAH